MKYNSLFLSFIFISVFSTLNLAYTEEKAYVEMFSPQGMVKNVRQVTARFSEQIVPFGDSRLMEPFDIACNEKGHARWADGKNWIYDFDRNLPAGIVCEFTLKQGIRSISGKEVEGRTFSFSTGGPAIRRSYPREGSQRINEDQIFILSLDAEATEESVISNVSCSIEGINERVGVRILNDEEKEKVLKIYGGRHYYDDYYFDDYYYNRDSLQKIILQCRQNFPNNSLVKLVWGKGVASSGGVPTLEDQVLTYKARDPFTATFHCSRENPKSDCIPVLDMSLAFSAPVAWEHARRITMTDTNNKVYMPSVTSQNEEKPEFVHSISFKGMFPENASFTIKLPENIKDDAGRDLANKDKFPLVVRTDAYPPLAKFSARFGIIELQDATLPVTLRNLEPEIKTRTPDMEEGGKGDIKKTKEGLLKGAVRIIKSLGSALSGTAKGKNNEMVEGLKGRLQKIQMDKDDKIIQWLRNVASAERKTSILKNEGGVKEFSIPKPGGSKAFEVVGIPLKNPGFYVVEMESQALGASLLGEQKPMYVPTAALVTNLSAHFKWGRESSLVWVTTLDKAEPVEGASVSLRDCYGVSVWEGKTDKDGIAAINKQLPSENALPNCYSTINYDESYPALGRLNRGLFIFAKKDDDMTFVHSSWDEGIEPWRYNLRYASYRGPAIAHTIFDRSLLRAGETVHMKHIIRKHTMAGFSRIKESELPRTAMIQHMGSFQRYEYPLKWDANGIAETEWKIPPDAKLGNYEITLLKKTINKPLFRTAVGGYERGDEDYYSARDFETGYFRVEEFRVPLMKGLIQMPKSPLINASEVTLDLFVSYLSGGGAGNAQVKLRSQLQPKYISFDDYEAFTFVNGSVKEGITTRSDYDEEQDEVNKKVQEKIQTDELMLDKAGSLRTKIASLPVRTVPNDLLAELEFKDPNGEIQTVSQKIPLWTSKLLVGIKPDSWASSKESLKFHTVVLDISGKPVPDKDVKVELFQKKYYSHRKRLIGGFYSYEHVTEVKRIGSLCEGKTDLKGLLICESQSPVSGNVIVQVSVEDDAGNMSVANQDVWIAGKDEWWFDVSDNDRIDLLPEQKKYEPGETAKFQVRMPFRDATALITVEREGIIETYIKHISGKMPVIEIPVKPNYAPNVFISALVVRGRVAGIQPTAMVDLGKPAYKLGIAEIDVGWKAHELKVNVSTDRDVYKIREKAVVKIKVKKADGQSPPLGSEVAIAAVDEGLLELMQNKSWNLLEAMMGKRGYEVRTSTAQMQVVGKRHYGLKALPQGGGGGRRVTRELFDTLLLWKARVALNDFGEASVEVPLNDSVTGFRIVAVANGGDGLFGTGQTSIRTTQELMIFSGIPPLVREGDKFKAGFTIRNASGQRMDVVIQAKIKNIDRLELQPLIESLSAGEAKDVGWDIDVPYGIDTLQYEVTAKDKNGDATDSLKARQKVIEAVPTRTFQATIAQVEKSFNVDIEKPKDAISGKGGINISFKPKLSDGLGGVTWYMQRYPYSCMEQRVSKAIALRDADLWKDVIAKLPSHIDSDGLVKYFPTCPLGDDTLTSYILSISNEAGWEIPSEVKMRMEEGLKGFIEGRVVRYSSLPTADLSIRKMAALESLSRSGKAELRLLGSIMIEPNIWPTSAVIDWTNVLLRTANMPERDAKVKEAEQILRSRLNFQGTTMGFSTEGLDSMWWLMVSADVNAVKSILTLLQFDKWDEDMPRLVRGALGRQYKGHWNITTANAWGVLAMEKFSKKFESVPVAGSTSALAGGAVKKLDWSEYPDGGSMSLIWPNGKESLSILHEGTGKPWAMVQSLAAIPLKEPFSSGYKIIKTLTPVEQKKKGKWSRGDVIRVKLELESQADMTWVVVNDPVPAGSNILGTGLGRDSQILTKNEENKGWVFPVFTERLFEAFRAYFEFVPKGKWTVEYTVRLNNSGYFHLPSTRVEALYSPEMFGEVPNGNIEVAP